MKRILIGDNDRAVRSQVGKYARLEGYEVAEAGDGDTAVSLCRQNAFDFVILAILLPKMDGFSVCQAIRSFSQVPILVLSERNSEQDRIHGLELGADDYMAKPFSPRELMLRISAILKRGGQLEALQNAQCIERQGIRIDLTARRLTVDGAAVSLTPKEFDLLVFLASNKGIALSREKILQKVWNYDYFGEDRTVDTHVKMLRGHLGKCRSYIATVWGIGYKFDPDAAR